MWRLRPQSVSTGITLRQLEACPQSPQPSHTASLMKMRCGGSGYSFFLRRRALLGGTGLFVDQDADALDLAQVALHRASSSSRGWNVVPRGNRLACSRCGA